MILTIGSDLHLEFSDLEELPYGEVLVLAGDIAPIRFLKANCGVPEARRFPEFLKKASSNFEAVIYVFGNHEHYKGRIDADHAKLTSYLQDSGLKNIHVLENETFEFKEVSFFGSTLWTDYNRASPIAMYDAKRMMNDFKAIKGVQRDGYRLTPEFLFEKHQEAKKALEIHLKNTNRKTVVVTHHAPTFLSNKREERGTSISYSYASDLSDLILDHTGKIPLWIHGHTHDNVDYEVDRTRVIAHMKGYGGGTELFQFAQVEV